MNFNLNRVKKLEEKQYDNYSKKNILYKMSREQRVEYNWSLIYAQNLALENNVKLFVIYTHFDKKWECVSRTVDFILENLKEVQKSLTQKNISFEYVEIFDDMVNNFPGTIKNENKKTSSKNHTSNFLTD
jgi:deoxyribodipyrimidine photo-lyase